MNTLFVYDKPMCCSTGVCGPEIDVDLSRFAADLSWLKAQGVNVQRYNLAQEPNRFLENPSVKQVLDRSGEQGLPIVMVNDQVASEGSYPTRDQLAGWLQIDEHAEPMAVLRQLPVIGNPPSSIFNQQIAELVALGASVAANCEPCFKYHHRQAEKLGVCRDDMVRAIDVALQVKERPAQNMLELTQRLVGNDCVEETNSSCGGGGEGCC